VEDDDASDVDEADEHDSLGAELEASGIFAEEGELVALTFSASLALRKRRSLALDGGTIDDRLLCAFFC